VQSVVRLTRAENPAEFVRAVEGRIDAIAHAHTLLAETGWKSVGLRALFERSLAPHDLNRVHLSGVDVMLPPVAAQPFALAIHELATNAAKYGSLSSAAGCLAVTWQLDPAAESVKVSWREAGGPPVQLPAHRSFGSTLITTTLEQQLGATVRKQWHPEGLVCDIAIPLERAGTSAHPAAPAADSREAKRILVVEDDMLIALDIQQTLDASGFDVVGPVGRVADALHLLDVEPVDAVVMDANLGGESAAPIAERLRSQGVPFVIATGYGAGPEFVVRGETPVLHKPFSAHDLQRAITELTARHPRSGGEADRRAKVR
jgi:two-component sensor histidine kinase/CheY-like chemotaxis protein